jgi:hypothetical protein
VNLGVSVAGHTAEWRFRDSPPLEAWLAGRPWMGRPEARVVRISDASLASAFIEGLRKAIRSHDDGQGNVLREVSEDDLAGGVVDALTYACAISPAEGNRFETFRRLVYALVDHPTVLVVPPLVASLPGLAKTPDPATRSLPGVAGAESSMPRLDEARDWLDGVYRTSNAVHVLVLLLDTPARPVTDEGVLDLSVGLPVGPLLGEMEPGEQWRAYLHHRLAWEVGGAPERAAARGEDVLDLGIGDDEGFERALNRAAVAESAHLSPELMRGARAYLEHQAKQDRSREFLAGEAMRLEREGLVWRPPEFDRLLPVPWLARALLNEKEILASIFHLRGCLVCAPLAHELLSRCFDLETYERAGLYAARGHRAPPEPAVKRWEDYHQSVSAELYPHACPGQPDGPWPLATFGEFLKVMADGEPRRDAWYRLLHLRNHLAHGHYVSWGAVCLLREVEEQLRG